MPWLFTRSHTWEHNGSGVVVTENTCWVIAAEFFFKFLTQGNRVTKMNQEIGITITHTHTQSSFHLTSGWWSGFSKKLLINAKPRKQLSCFCEREAWIVLVISMVISQQIWKFNTSSKCHKVTDPLRRSLRQRIDIHTKGFMLQKKK